MELTTLCYIEKDDKYLMLHRIEDVEDINSGKWMGVGGHFEKFESPEDCVVREIKEETGLELTSYSLRGMVTFISDKKFSEYIFIFSAKDFSGELIDCDEGSLEWIDKKDVMNLDMWEGDRIFLKLLEESGGFFSMKLEYEEEKVVGCTIDGEKIPILDEILGKNEI